MPISRRTLIASALACPAAAHLWRVHAAATPNGYLGVPIADLASAINGVGTWEIVRTGDRHITLDHAASNTSPSIPLVFLQADMRGLTEFVEFDGSSLPQGMPDTENPAWRRNALPADVRTILRATTPAMGSEGVQLDLEMFSSSWLARENHRSGNGIFVWQSDPAFSARQKVARRLNIATESTQPFEIMPAGSSPGIRATYDEWTSAYGDPPAHQGGFSYQVSPDQWVSVDGASAVESAWARYQENPAGLNTVAQHIARLLPADATMEQTYLLFPTPTGPGAMRIQGWHLPSAATNCVVTIEYTGNEQDAQVRSFSVVTAA